jgi:hypothetical protein
MNSLIRPVVFVSLFLLLSSPELALGDSDLEQRFLRDAPRGWAKLSAAECRLAGVAHIEHWSTTKGQKTVHIDNHIEFKRNGDLVRLVQSGAKKESSFVHVVGPRYFFRLTRPSPKAPYVLRDLSFGQPITNIKDEGLLSSTYFFRASQFSREFWDVPLEGLIADPGFKLKRISEGVDGTKKIVRVEFVAKSAKYKREWRSAWMELCPDENWALQKAEHWPRSDWRQTITNEFRTSKDGQLSPYRSRIVSRFSVSEFSKEEIEQTYQFTLDELEDRVVPESEFTLPAFGLPEMAQS